MKYRRNLGSKIILASGFLVFLGLILLSVGLGILFASCQVQPPPVATNTAVIIPTLAPDQPGYVFSHKIEQELWPAEIGGLPVGYVRVADEVAMHYAATWPKQFKLFLIYGQAYNDRIIAKPGKWLAVYALGDDFHWGTRPRPFSGDGGMSSYQVMDEQIVDGHLLGDEPVVFFMPLWACDLAYNPVTGEVIDLRVE
jgi:hypothetical protein